MKNSIVLISFLVLALFSCQQKTESYLVLISKDSHSNIEYWLKHEDSNIKTRVFYTIPKDSMQYYLSMANGIVLGGGEDVNPLMYNKPLYDTICEPPDNYRDSIETLMINFAMENKLPLLGICRGNQIMNVVNGGTLIPDIPSFVLDSNIHHRFKGDSAHVIIPIKDSWMTKNLKLSKEIWVNSHHHQAVDKLAPNFKVSAFSSDSIVESIELADKSLNQFAVGIQWHPESLKDNLAKQIARLYLKKVKE